uniref:Putative diguanylate cyclase n=1 Tax=termite gut metagenome TaxID=433724 RepID=S0DG21_9ZZZZ
MDVFALSVFLVLQIFSVVLSAVVVCVAITKRRIQRSLNYILYAVATLMCALGYLLEITAPTLEAAVVACKVQYLGVPYLGVFYYLFARDYCNLPPHSRTARALLLAFPAAATLLVFTWPAQRLFYAGLSFTAATGLPHLVVSPGPLYFPHLLYGYALALISAFLVVRSLMRGRRRQARRATASLVSFGVASALVLGFQVCKFAAPPASGFDLMPLVFSLHIAALGLFFVRFRLSEWTVLGRDSIVENMKDAFILVDGEGRYLDANRQARRFLPGLAEIAPGASLTEADAIPKALGHNTAAVNEFTVTDDTGGEVHLRATRTPLVADGRVVGTSILVYDVSEIYQLMTELRQMATLDSLTGIYNRGTFFMYAQRDFDLALRKGEAASLLMMDLDHFKKVNDEHGHLAGDQVLVGLAGILKARLRHTDITGRYGGEEIAVWLPGANISGAALIADVIRRALEHTVFESEKGRFNVTLSIGVAGLDAARHQTLEALIADADTALYVAKTGGRNQVVTFSLDNGE